MPTVAAVLLCRSVALLFFPCRVIQPKAVQPAGRRAGLGRRTGPGSGGHPATQQTHSPVAQPQLTVHAGEVCLAEDGSYPQLLGIHVRAHQGVARRHLDHGLQLAAHPVSLQDTTPCSAQALHRPLLLSRTGAAFLPQLQQPARRSPCPKLCSESKNRV